MGFWHDIEESFSLKSELKDILAKTSTDTIDEDYNTFISMMYSAGLTEGTANNILEDVNKTFIAKAEELGCVFPK